MSLNQVLTLSETQISKLHGHLLATGWECSELNYGYWKASRNKTTVAAYKSGKVTFQGKDTPELIQFYIEPEITGILEVAEVKEEDIAAQLEPHAGIDESGKGDFFGPLVICCAYTDTQAAKSLMKLGVTDSKKIKTDAKIATLATEIKKILQGRYAVVAIGPEAYNRMYSQKQNLNTMLGWGHARSLENLLGIVPGCPFVISDQFSKTGSVTKALMEKGKQIKLIERTKAESDIAVAAASIIARHEFVSRLKKLSDEIGIELPKGASTKVIEAGKKVLEKCGKEGLEQVSKTHFKTTLDVLGEN